jgi:putative radical SAM enzyme (TIGR03279 family)
LAPGYIHAMNIVSITPRTPAAKLGIQAGDKLLTINKKIISDVIDYEFYAADEELEIVTTRDGIKQVHQVAKGLDEELGIGVQPMQIRACANNCVFCFAHQNPPGVRDALNFKDGDFRFSFLHGHYITMTNMGPKKLERVVEQHLSPLYISVHVTDPEKRKEMLLYGKDDNLMGKLSYLTSNGIELHTQIVLCPGWNDGDILLNTIRDLMGFAPGVRSVSIVPVGLTKYRDNLPQLTSYTQETAKTFISWFSGFENEFGIEGIDRFVYLSDEFFILADLPIPDNDYYGDFSMVENGVGQCRDFENRFKASIPMLPEKLKGPTRLLFATGTLGFPFLSDTISPTLDQIQGLDYEIVPIVNHWLGADTVTVTGLVSARDLVTQLKHKGAADAVYLSYRMFSEDGVTLDDHTREDIEKKLGIPVYIHHEDMLEILQPWV